MNSVLPWLFFVWMATPDPSAMREAAAAWIEGETAEATDGVDIDRRKAETTSNREALGVHPDRVAGVRCRWSVALKRPVSSSRLAFRYACMKASSYRLSVDGAVVGMVRFPPTGGWGYEADEWSWGVAPIGRKLDAGKHTIELTATGESRPMNIDCLALPTGAAALPVPLQVSPAPKVSTIELPARQAPRGWRSQAFRLGQGGDTLRIWGGGTTTGRFFPDEFLPGLFERTLVLDEMALDGGSLSWIFTGPHGGFTVELRDGKVTLYQRFYDSFGFNELEGGEVRAHRHPERRWVESAVRPRGRLQSITIVADHKLGLRILLNGKSALEQVCELDVKRHQLRLAGGNGRVKGRILSPPLEGVLVRLDPSKRGQTMMGFGGITTPTAYAQLSEQGKRRWWQMVCEHNMLIQREYPIGTRLAEDMDNWDRLADATPHYYGDNFPNGEISDFAYIKTLRRLGGRVFFEFWKLPPWATQDWKDSNGKVHKGVADPVRYAKAMVDYCKTSQRLAGAPPDIVGIQNEVRQPSAIWHAMTMTLRKALDKAGFQDVRIHMSDHGILLGGIGRAKAFRESVEAWRTIDFAATHMYDYQARFTDPDGYDGLLEQWHELTKDKPFLSTELCINAGRHQRGSYRLALLMGQLYHKNLTIADAVAICYCWTLLNVEQPSYGMTRSLCVPDREEGFVPVASSHQLRVFGAYSRRIKAGMQRIEAASDCEDVLASAFVGAEGRHTLVLLNRSSRPKAVTIRGDVGPFTEMETTDAYRPNVIGSPPKRRPDNATTVAVSPGAIVTLTTVPLGALPADFEIAR